MAVSDMIQLIERAPPDRWPGGWAGWENVKEAHRRMAGRFLDALPPYVGSHAGRGIVIGGGGSTYFPCAWVAINALRKLGCSLPIQLWYLGEAEMDARMERLVAPLGVECVDAHAVARADPCRILRGWELKPYMAKQSRFREVLLLDADNVPLRDPTYLFEEPGYRAHGSVLWPDLHAQGPGESHVMHRLKPDTWATFGLSYRDEPPVESGQVLVEAVPSSGTISRAGGPSGTAAPPNGNPPRSIGAARPRGTMENILYSYMICASDGMAASGAKGTFIVERPRPRGGLGCAPVSSSPR
jgi:hypothetical protein